MHLFFYCQIKSSKINLTKKNWLRWFESTCVLLKSSHECSFRYSVSFSDSHSYPTTSLWDDCSKKHNRQSLICGMCSLTSVLLILWKMYQIEWMYRADDNLQVQILCMIRTLFLRAQWFLNVSLPMQQQPKGRKEEGMHAFWNYISSIEDGHDKR